MSFEKELSRLFTPECYYEQLPGELMLKRDKMVSFLSEVGMVPTVPEGGYFMVVDFSHLGMSNVIKCDADDAFKLAS